MSPTICQHRVGEGAFGASSGSVVNSSEKPSRGAGQGWWREWRRTRSRTSRENLVVVRVMAPASQRLEPPANPGRFTLGGSRWQRAKLTRSLQYEESNVKDAGGQSLRPSFHGAQAYRFQTISGTNENKASTRVALTALLKLRGPRSTRPAATNPAMTAPSNSTGPDM